MRVRMLIGALSCVWCVGAACAAWAEYEDCDSGSLEAQPKNVIVMIGDGMGPQQLKLARLFAESEEGGEKKLTLYDPDLGLDPDPSSMTTHNVYGEVTDSAAAATAMATGIKTYNGALAVDVYGQPITTAWECAEFVSGKKTGIVSSVFLIDATPGVWAAHTTSRYNYSEVAVQQALKEDPDLEPPDIGEVEVLLGAGRIYYQPKGANGTGGPNLIEMLQDQGYDYVRKASELERSAADKILGFFGGTAMTYVLNRPLNKNLTEPTLADMTAKAIEILDRDNDNGFFLVVEGGGIDWVAHKLDVAGTLHEVLGFDEAVAEAFEFAKANGDTLLVVTADHETGGLQVGELDAAFLAGIRATTDFIQTEIDGGMTIEAALETYAGVGGKGSPWPKLSAQEIQHIQSCGDALGISDVLNARAGVSWGWSDCKGGHHTGVEVDVFAYGPGAEKFGGDAFDNTNIGILLKDAVTH